MTTKILSRLEAVALDGVIARVETAVRPLANLLGSAYGASWTDRGLKLAHKVEELRYHLESAHEREFGLPLRELSSLDEFVERRQPPLRSHRLVPLSEQDHRDLGARLKRLHNDVVGAVCLIGRSHALSDAPVRVIRSIERDLAQLRFDLDSIAINTLGLGTDVYYGGGRKMETAQ